MIGEGKPIGEMIVIQIFTLALKELGLGPIIVHINSVGDKECRGEYRKNLSLIIKNICPISVRIASEDTKKIL